MTLGCVKQSRVLMGTVTTPVFFLAIRQGNSIFVKVMSCHVNIKYVKLKVRFDRRVLSL